MQTFTGQIENLRLTSGIGCGGPNCGKITFAARERHRQVGIRTQAGTSILHPRGQTWAPGNILYQSCISNPTHGINWQNPCATMVSQLQTRTRYLNEKQ